VPDTCVVVDPPPGNRCNQVTKGRGDQPLIDDFEPGPTHTATCAKIREVDGRAGKWNSGVDNVNPMNKLSQTFEPPGAGAAPGSTQALHVVGSALNGYGGFVATPLAPCYDASAYQGISFWFKGDPARTPSMKVSVVTPGTAATTEGGSGSCAVGGGAGQGCYDHFTVQTFKVSDIWTRYTIVWSQLTQYGWGKAVPRTERPETEIIGLVFSPDWDTDAANMAPNKSFDFWIDDVSFDITGNFAQSSLLSFIRKADFDAAFAGFRAGAAANPFFANAYDDLAETLNDPRFSRIGREGTADDRKREIASMLAHIAQETGSLRFVSELTPPADGYCVSDLTYPCAPGKLYFGRGPIQMTGNRNYGQASEFLGLGNMLLANPDILAQDAKLSWRGALFYWMGWKTTDGTVGILFGPHTKMIRQGFGASIKAVNSPECVSAGDPRAIARQNFYQGFCQRIGVGGCDQNLTCM
jgi:chitinase